MKNEIILIDDDFYGRENLSKLLQDSFNINIVAPENINELKESISKEIKFAGALVDLNLGSWKDSLESTSVDAIDIIKTIRNNNKNIPIAVFSANLDESEYKSRIKSLNIGDNDFLIEKKLLSSKEIDNEKNLLLDFLEQTIFNPKEKLSLEEIYNQDEIVKLNNGIESIRNEVQIINRSIIHELNKNPYAIYNLNPREFEELIAELYIKEGYQVELTPQTRDGGVDIFAYKKDELHDILLGIECKRYSPTKKVGRPDIMKLHSRVEFDRLTGGVLATSSYFTNDATMYTKALKNRIFLKDFL